MGQAISDLIRATRGITAGSGLATTEMRLVMINIVDRALQVYPSVTPTLFVDDLSAESVAVERHIKHHLVGFVHMVCRRIKADGMEVSTSKSVSTASDDKLGQEIAELLAQHGVKSTRKTKSLGTGLGSGVRPNASVINKRLKQFRKKIVRFRMLKKAGVDTAKVLRTGGVAALPYGQATAGTAPTTLLQQRRAVAAAAAPASGLAGQNIDLALMLADGSAAGRVDPAYEAHAQPIGHWAQAVWNGWLPMKHLLQLVADAKVRLDKARQPWMVVYGPSAAFVCTAARLQWTVCDAVNVITDEGRRLKLNLDPPAVVVKAAHEAVRRWGWRSIENVHHSLAASGTGRGAVMDPIWKLLRSRENSRAWNPSLRGALRSAIANRQWPQARAFKAGFASHAKCLFCVHGARKDSSSESRVVLRAAAEPQLRDPTPISDINGSGMESSASGARSCPPLPPPTQQEIDTAPAGTGFHRIWKCPRLEVSRQRHAPASMIDRAAALGIGGDVAFERALFPTLVG